MMGWGEWQWPHGPLAWSAACAGALVLLACVRPLRRWLTMCVTERPLRSVAPIAVLSALASAWYVPLVLGGAPRIIDATAYWLQARIFASGHVAMQVAGPASSYRGRFLLEVRPGAFAGIFPPGYPAVLGVFHALGSPWLLGPLLALGLCAMTARLAGLLAPAASKPWVAWVAAVLSLACGAVRHHTAETMSHGLTMLAVAAALVTMLEDRRGATLLAGALLGLVLITRFASALALGPVLLAGLVIGRRDGARRALGLVVGFLPFVVGLALYQRAVTGSMWVTPQSLYYLRADAPSGCFRYGFGAGIGCDYEHGSFVAAHLPDHFVGPVAALGTTLRRLRLHALDVVSFEPLVALVLVGVHRLRRTARPSLLAYPLLVVLAYAPFYFDGNYPGGGARFFSDALPLEHALIAVAVGAFEVRSLLVVAAAFLGFAVHAAPEHEKLRARDGGEPMWNARAAVSPLVLTNTDHGFDLGHEPGGPVDVARFRGDANDALRLARAGGASLAWFHIEPPGMPGSGLTVRPLELSAAPPWRFEGESEWPVRALHASTAVPIDTGPQCSAGRALALTALAPDARVTTSLWLPTAGRYHLELRAGTPHGRVRGKVSVGNESRAFVVDASSCAGIELGAFELQAGDHDVTWEWETMGTPSAATFWLDALDARPEFLIVGGAHDEK